jgi:predicted peroxiredoxin
MVTDKFMSPAEKEMRRLNHQAYHKMMHERGVKRHADALALKAKQDRHHTVIERIRIRVRSLIKGMKNNG